MRGYIAAYTEDGVHAALRSGKGPTPGNRLVIADQSDPRYPSGDFGHDPGHWKHVWRVYEDDRVEAAFGQEINFLKYTADNHPNPYYVEPYQAQGIFPNLEYDNGVTRMFVAAELVEDIKRELLVRMVRHDAEVYGAISDEINKPQWRLSNLRHWAK